jgi:ATP-binding cassette subfamily B protein
LGLAPAFVSGTGSPTGLAIGIGGMLLAWRALKGLTYGLWNLAGAAIAWKLVEPLFRAASRPQAHGIPGLIGAAAQSETIIDAQNIFFRYQGRAEAVLRGCNLRVGSGDHLVLDGPSGSGKSTLSSLIAGLREPDSGLLLAGGLDRRTLGADRWRRVVACAPQFHENHVLCGPFAFNLLMGRPGQLGEADVEEAEAICRELGLGDLLTRMPAGIMQMVGETGWQLSHGERGRLFMARALLQQSEVIVLDESFAALDPENLRLALNCVCKRAGAALVIAHR